MHVCVDGGGRGLVIAHLIFGLEPLVLYWWFAHSVAAEAQIVARHKSYRLGLNEDLQGCTFRRFSLWIHTLSYIVTLVSGRLHNCSNYRQFLCRALMLHIKIAEVDWKGILVPSTEFKCSSHCTNLPIEQFWSTDPIICFILWNPKLTEPHFQWQPSILLHWL